MILHFRLGPGKFECNRRSWDTKVNDIKWEFKMKKKNHQHNITSERDLAATEIMKQTSNWDIWKRGKSLSQRFV